MKNKLKTAWSYISFIGTVLLMVFIITTFIMQSYEVVGQSMEPTLQNGDRLIISKLGKTFSLIKRSDYVPERGDIIVFHNPQEDPPRLIKRVVAFPGERVVLKNGRLKVYNELNPKGFDPDKKIEGANFEFSDGVFDKTVTEGNLFVSGDNRLPGQSLDSRNSLGLVPIDSVMGKLTVRIMPLNKARFF